MFPSQFKEVFPSRRGKSSDPRLANQQVKISFPIIRNREDSLHRVHAMVMYLGKNLCKPLNVQEGDKIKFFFEKDNPRIWWIKKANDGTGYTLFNPKGADNPTAMLKFQMTWRIFKPDETEITTRVVPHEFYQSGIRVTLPHLSPLSLLNQQKQVA
jgi:hypothetical protein